MARRFAELGIKVDDGRKIFDCPQVSITDILNTEIEVIDYTPGVTTKHGEGRYVVLFANTATGEEGKFFTNAAPLKAALDKVQKEDFPFLTVIKAAKCGDGKTYRFT